MHTHAEASDADKGARVAFVSLGCAKNLVDSENMLGTLASHGMRIVGEQDRPDAIVINTCGFLESAKEESLEVIRAAVDRKQAGELKRVIVAGCLVQRHREKLLEWAPGIDAMIGVFDRDRIVEAVGGQRSEAGASTGASTSVDSKFANEPLPRYWIAANALQAARARGRNTVGLTVNGADGRGIGYFEDDSRRFRLTPRHWAYLRVSEGCNQRCAFCTIPSIRGKMRSKPPATIVAEARQLMSEGVFELNLIGQDTTSYGYDIGYQKGLVGLLEALDAAAADFGGGWIRLMYAYPSNFSDEMIDVIARLPHVVKYIDMPLQHISDNMLSAMRRQITRKQQEQLLDKLRDRVPGVAIRTTFITGFPGETLQDHRELVEFIEDFGFDMMGVFRYSHEDGTVAGTMDDDTNLHVPDDVKVQREAELMLAQQRIAFENAAYVARQRCEFDVLIDKRADESGWIGRCYHQAPQVDSVTRVRSANELAPGELVRCTIVESDGYDFIARPTAEVREPLGAAVSC